MANCSFQISRRAHGANFYTTKISFGTNIASSYLYLHLLSLSKLAIGTVPEPREHGFSQLCPRVLPALPEASQVDPGDIQ